MVRQQLEVVQSEVNTTKHKWSEARSVVFENLSFLEKRCLTKLVEQQVAKKIANDKCTINKKLQRTWSKHKSRSPDCILNLSSKELDVCEKNVLYLGLKHHILPKKIRDADIKVNIEKMMKSLVLHLGHPLDYDTKEEVKCEVQSFVKSVRRTCSSQVNKSFHQSINKLSKDDSISICKVDKGNGVVILDKQDYLNKCYAILSDTSKFQRLETADMVDIILKKRASLKNYVYKYLSKNNDIDKSLYIII